MEQVRGRFFLRWVLAPGLTAFACFQAGNALPRPTNLDLLFYLPVWPLGAIAAFGAIFWLAKVLAGLFVQTPAEAPPGVLAQAIGRSLERKRREALEAPSGRAEPLARFKDASHHLAVLVDGDRVVLSFFEHDDEPLRPQSFALGGRRLKAALEALKGQETYVVTQGGDSLELSSRGADTRDPYGAHFSVHAGQALVDALHQAQQQLPPSLRPEDELRPILADLRSGSRNRFDPTVVAAVTELRDHPELDPLVQPLLNGNPDEALFAAAFLYKRRESKSELAESMLRIIEKVEPGPVREAAEGTLTACFHDHQSLMTQPTLARVVGRIPWKHSPRAIGSALRPVLEAGPRAKPFHADLKKQREALARKVASSRAVEDDQALSMLDELLGS